MTERKYVVLDLFIINAITSDDLDLYFRTAAILQLIIDKCYKIILSPSLKTEYVHRLKQLARSGYTNDRLFKYLKKLLVNSEKITEVPDLAYDILVKVPRKDLSIVKAALAKKSNTIIITTDEKHFINNSELQEFLKSNNIEVLLLKESLSKLSKDP